MQINGLGHLPNIARPEGPEKAPSQGQFATLINQYVNQTNHQKLDASKAAVELATGKSHNVSETMLALQKADVSFQLMLSVRNKIVDAYREVMRMQV
ncbi:MAG: flagellar hook-basal body complex protein FliE [Mariprofundaceae bacterium]|nr:flagellar hook-basal body complex protein FliE [Mariprofundaceae bacterium]